jgi:predicted nucleic acid-binding protein
MKKPEVMLDLGVLVAVLLAPAGASALLYDRWLRGEFELAIAKRQLKQLGALLSRRAFQRDYVRPNEAARFLSVLEEHARVVQRWSFGDLLRVQRGLPEVARAAGADVLVTMEPAHLEEDVAVAPLILEPVAALGFLDSELAPLEVARAD